ncbi:hypothetical protein, partial [Clostridioides difficile]|uniref:hypothetical protein n=1 Tax=Clostridioides difficile TaxID=1496 RepID=UPI003F8D493A
ESINIFSIFLNISIFAGIILSSILLLNGLDCKSVISIFFNSSTWPDGKSIGIDMNANKILEYAKLFGLDQNTGLQDEVEERAGK